MLRDFVLFVDGQRLARCPRVTPPVLETQYEEERVGGRSAPVEIPTGIAPLTMEIVIKGISAQLARRWGLSAANPVSLILRGVSAAEDGTLSRVQLDVTGVVARMNPGEWRSGQPAETTVQLREISYYKRTDGDAVIHEYDVANDVLIVDGTDVLAERRSLLGI